MFEHHHPYKPFIHEDTTKLIVGTLPPPRFYKGKLKPGDVDFCYGSIDGLLWPILDKVFDLKLSYETTTQAVLERKQFLKSRNIGVCDIVASCVREKIDASDAGMTAVVLRDVVHYLEKYPNINTLLFTGGNSKNGPEYFFRKHLKQYHIRMDLISNELPRIHQFKLEGNFDARIIKTVSLISPSGSANRSIGGIPLYKKRKAENPNYSTLDYRAEQYKRFF